MPIVDVRNIPTVVEFAPENKVVEFTEEAVTAEVVVGPTVVEFSWGELVPEPGLSGGGVFEGRVYIRPDIPTLPTNSEPVDPENDYIMLYDASGDQHVKVLAALGGGSGGESFDVANVGTGAEVYKETVLVDEVSTAHLRTLVSSDDSVSIVQNTDEIDLTVDCSCGGGLGCTAPDALFIGSVSTGCGTTVSTTPGTAIPAAQAGDLAVWVIMLSSQLGTGPYPYISLPTGWSWLIQPNEQSKYIAAMYKFLTEEDLTTTVSTTRGGSYVRNLCERLYVYRNVNAKHPFGAVSVRQNVEVNNGIRGYAEPIPVFADSQWILAINMSTKGGFAGTDWPDDSTLIPCGQTTFDDEYKNTMDGASADGEIFFDLTTWAGSVNSDENLIGGETVTETVPATEWLGTRITRATRGTSPHQRIWATGTSGTHYLEKTISLTGGEKYTWASLFNFGTGSSLVMSVTDPNGDERAGECGRSGSVDFIHRLYIDETGDHGTNWLTQTYACHEDGAPSDTGGWFALHFIAPATGTYTLRLYLTSGYNGSIPGGLTYAGDGAHSIDLRHVGLRRGYVTPMLVETGTGPVTGGSATKRTQGRGWLNHPFRTADKSSVHYRYQIAINPAWSGLPLARLNAAMIGENDASADDRTSSTGLETQYRNFGSDDSTGAIAVDRLIYPTKNGVAGKYYFESTVTSPTTAMAIGVAPIGCPIPTGDDTPSRGYGYGVVLSGATTTPDSFTNSDISITNTTGDVWGVAVDYDAGTVKFYQNNVLKKTMNLLNGSVGGTTADLPLRAVLACSGSNAGKWTLNLRGPFVYGLPSGHAAYDEDGSPTASGGVAGYVNTGDGVGLSELVTLPTGCEYLKIKSLVEGANISITDNGDDITIAVTGLSYSLSDLTDVDVTTPSDGDVLTWDTTSAAWVASAPSGGGSFDTSLDYVLTGTWDFEIVPRVKTGVTPADTHWSSVSALIRIEDTATDLTGKSTITVTGSPAISSVQAKVGAKSYRIPGTGTESTNYVRLVGGVNDFVFTGEFTVEGWFYCATQSATYMPFFGSGVNGNTNTWTVSRASGGNIGSWDGGGGASGGSTSLGTWFHLALTRNASNLLTLWIDGTAVATATRSGTYGVSNGTTESYLDVGRGWASDNGDLDGYFEELRVTKGVCRYTTTFTPDADGFDTTPIDVYETIRVDDLGNVDVTGLADNHVLVYDSATSTWKPESPGAATLPVTTEGDIIVRGPSTADRLGVGSNGQVLTVDTSVSGKLKWATPSGGGGGSGPISVDSYPSSPDSMDDEFEGTSLDGKWSWCNQSSATATFASGALNLYTPAASGDNLRSIVQPISGSAWKIRAKVAVSPIGSLGVNYMGGGLTVRNSTGSKNIVFGPFFASGWKMYADKRTDTSFGSSLANSNLTDYWYRAEHWGYLEIELASGVLTFRSSSNGLLWRQIATENVSTYLGSITHVGLMTFIGNGSIPNSLLADWFRRIT